LNEFWASLWCEFAHFPFVFDAHVGDYPCTDQIYTKSDVFVYDYVIVIKICQGQLYTHYSNPSTKYTWCFQGVPWFGWLHSQHNASKMESKFLGPQHRGCWIFMFWLCGFYFLGYKFRCPLAKYLGVLGDLQWSCGCYKCILFKFFVSTHFESIFIWVHLSLCLFE